MAVMISFSILSLFAPLLQSPIVSQLGPCQCQNTLRTLSCLVLSPISLVFCDARGGKRRQHARQRGSNPLSHTLSLFSPPTSLPRPLPDNQGLGYITAVAVVGGSQVSPRISAGPKLVPQNYNLTRTLFSARLRWTKTRLLLMTFSI